MHVLKAKNNLSSVKPGEINLEPAMTSNQLKQLASLDMLHQDVE
jgi:hypothetical protein